MSDINYSDPQVLKNWIKSQMKEGKGEFYVKPEVHIFKINDIEFIVPEDMVQKLALEGEAETEEAVAEVEVETSEEVETPQEPVVETVEAPVVETPVVEETATTEPEQEQ